MAGDVGETRPRGGGAGLFRRGPHQHLRIPRPPRQVPGWRHPRGSAWIAQTAREKKDPGCIKALDLFAEILGNVAGDHALATLARGGVYLAGGVIAKLAPSFNKEKFRAAFCAKELFAAQMMRIPVKVVTNEKIALIGAARVAEAL